MFQVCWSIDAVKAKKVEKRDRMTKLESRSKTVKYVASRRSMQPAEVYAANRGPICASNRDLCDTTEYAKEEVLKTVKSEWSCVTLSVSHIEDLCKPHTSMQSRKGGRTGCFYPEILSLIQLYKYLGYFYYLFLKNTREQHWENIVEKSNTSLEDSNLVFAFKLFLFFSWLIWWNIIVYH